MRYYYGYMVHDVMDVYLNQYHIIYLIMDMYQLENDLQLVSRKKKFRKEKIEM
jgi:hypothetical protein